MKFETKTPLLSLKPTYRKDSIQQSDFENFTKAYHVLIQQMEKAILSDQSEEHHKGLVADFLEALIK